MGTVVSFLVEPGHLSSEDVGRALDEAVAELHRIDDRFSTWKPESELSRLRAREIDRSSKLMDEVYELCAHAVDISRGYFDPWKMPGGFDPTGLVKGWAADRALAILAGRGITSGLINAGGDVCVLAGESHDVGIRHPSTPDALCAVVTVSSSVATSGVYERGDHLINPYGGDVAAVSATVVGGPLALCDALATALAVGGKEVLYLLEQVTEFEGFFIDARGDMFATSGMVLSAPSAAVERAVTSTR
ncbi:MAG TPA: FAD:protein FMN transferase [Acidimicrobiales bacterium]|nr:FAD:protein FMN transferase [Acidimicrobiales bacterium]